VDEPADILGRIDDLDDDGHALAERPRRGADDAAMTGAEDAVEYGRAGEALGTRGFHDAFVGRRVRRAVRAVQIDSQQDLFAVETHQGAQLALMPGHS